MAGVPEFQRRDEEDSSQPRDEARNRDDGAPDASTIEHTANNADTAHCAAVSILHQLGDTLQAVGQGSPGSHPVSDPCAVAGNTISMGFSHNHFG